MKRLLLVLTLLVNGCATTYSQLRVERVGPVEVEIWKNNKTGKCERRIYLDSMPFITEVDCVTREAKAKAR